MVRLWGFRSWLDWTAGGRITRFSLCGELKDAASTCGIAARSRVPSAFAKRRLTGVFANFVYLEPLRDAPPSRFLWRGVLLNLRDAWAQIYDQTARAATPERQMRLARAGYVPAVTNKAARCRQMRRSSYMDRRGRTPAGHPPFWHDQFQLLLLNSHLEIGCSACAHFSHSEWTRTREKSKEPRENG